MRAKRFIVLAAIGLGLSLALEFLHVRAYLLPTLGAFCAIGERLDCTSVALSRFSVIAGVPVPLWGALGFVAILVAAQRRSRWLVPLTAAGALASLALLVIELAAIGSLCLLCEAVHVVSFLLFLFAWRERGGLSKTFGNRDDVIAIFSAPLGLLVALFLFVPRYWGIFGWKGDLPFPHGRTEQGHPWIGARNPTLVVEEFTDYACPHCRAASARTLKRIADHPNSLRVVRRQYPRVHCRVGFEQACGAARLAYCADQQDRFWHADRWLFEHGAERARIDLTRAAKDIGLAEDKLRACVTRTDTYEWVEKEAELALKKRFPGSPYYVVGSKRSAEAGLSKLLEGLP